MKKFFQFVWARVFLFLFIGGIIAAVSWSAKKPSVVGLVIGLAIAVGALAYGILSKNNK